MLSPDCRGANIWLVIPNDEGVSHEAGHPCFSVQSTTFAEFHSIQLYLDLKGHPERRQEVATQLGLVSRRRLGPHHSRS